MRVSHESPLQLLELSRSYNDYDYALVHLFEKNKEYFDFFVESLRRGREVILDNSIFELGEAFDMDEFAKWINRLVPTYYIVPDVMNDADGTIANLERWMKDYWPDIDQRCKIMCVVQGKNYEDMIRCYKAIEKYADKIAFTFGTGYFADAYNSTPAPEGFNQENWDRMGRLAMICNGRIDMIMHMDRDDVINREKKHHLLGCALPQEIQFYKYMPFIDSVDTSNPVVHGMFGIRYDENGLTDKKDEKLADMLNAKVDDKELEDIQYNIKMFRRFV